MPPAMAQTPPRTRIRDTTIQNFRYFMKSIFVLRNSSITCSLFEARGASDRKLLHLAAGQNEVEDPMAHEHRREEGGEEADRQRDGEALDGAGAELKQEQRR